MSSRLKRCRKTPSTRKMELVKKLARQQANEYISSLNEAGALYVHSNKIEDVRSALSGFSLQMTEAQKLTRDSNLKGMSQYLSEYMAEYRRILNMFALRVLETCR